MNSANNNKKQLDVSIIIINRNGKEITKNCLNKLISENVKQIIIVDNNSTDGSLEMLEQFKQRNFRIIKNNENKGYAEANNQGYLQAIGKYIVFLNNDTIPTKGFLEPLLTYLEKNSKVAAVQPLLLFPDKTIDSVGSFLTPTGFLYHRAHRQIPNVLNAQPNFAYTLKGACMVWKKTILDSIGIFDESYFAYFEETELCNRAIRKGYRLAIYPKSVVIHLGGYTSNAMNQTFIQFLNTKNRIQTYIRHLPLKVAWEIIPLHLLLTEVLAIYTFLRSPSVAWSIQKGMFFGIYAGIKNRLSDPPMMYDLSITLKKPDFWYYKALFSSLKNFQKLW